MLQKDSGRALGMAVALVICGLSLAPLNAGVIPNPQGGRPTTTTITGDVEVEKILLRYEDYELEPDLYYFAELLEEAGYTVEMDYGFGIERGDILHYGDPNVLGALLAIESILGSYLNFSEFRQVRFDNDDLWYEEPILIFQFSSSNVWR